MWCVLVLAEVFLYVCEEYSRPWHREIIVNQCLLCLGLVCSILDLR